MSVTWGEFREKPGATYLYVQLADWITAHIQAGRLKPGDRLPAQRELGELTGTSTELAGKSMALLRERGLVETSGRGSFVKPAG
jgi:DNA-binding GntR family transcriptional regulator